MKNSLSLVFTLVLTFGAFAPLSTFAGIGDPCTTNVQCNTAAGESCDNANSTSQFICIGSNLGGGGATGGAGSVNTTQLQSLATSIQSFINTALVPLLIAVAFIVFLWGVFKYFIWGAADEEARTKGRSFIMYGILGFVVIFSIWGIVNIGVSLFGVGTGARPSTLPYPTL